MQSTDSIQVNNNKMETALAVQFLCNNALQKKNKQTKKNLFHPSIFTSEFMFHEWLKCNYYLENLPYSLFVRNLSIYVVLFVFLLLFVILLFDFVLYLLSNKP